MTKKMMTALIAFCLICISAFCVTETVHADTAKSGYPAAYPAGGIEDIRAIKIRKKQAFRLLLFDSI